MKNYKKGILTVAVLASMSLFSAEDTIIYVNTFDDEDINNDKCSLREAVKAASLHRPYNGCKAGVPSNTTAPNLIRLEEGDYYLNSELQLNSAIVIEGKAPEDWSKIDPVLNDFPAKLPIKTNIIGRNTRLINTSNIEKPTLTLQNLHLKQGQSSTNGGALNLGGNTSLVNVWISDSQALSGGAIYLDGSNSTIAITGGQFTGNTATNGSVIAMSCRESLTYTKRSLNFTGSTYLNNGSANDASIFSFCGEPAINVFSNTITQNTVSSTSGSIIKFYADIVGSVQNLSNASSLILSNNTIVKNTGQGIFSYDQVGAKALNYNVLGFNTGKSCMYRPGDIANIEKANLKITNNAFNLTVGNDHCELPKEVLLTEDNGSINLTGVAFDNVLSPLYQPSDFTNFISMYFPKNLSNDQDLVDSGNTSCIKLDQRGLTRIIDSQSAVSDTIKNSCDIGAVEALRFTLNDKLQTNVSITDLLKSYRDEIGFFKDMIADSQTPKDFLPFYENRLKYFENLEKLTESNTKYRPIYFDPFVGNMPDEIVFPDGGRKIQNLNKDNYTVNPPVVKGVGLIDSKTQQFVGIFDSNLKCEWDTNLERIVMYRTDDRITPAGDLEVCEYSLSSKVAPFKTETAYLTGSFLNIAPNVKDEFSYTIEHGKNEKVILNLLDGADDAGDGSTKGLTTQSNKSPFYLNQDDQTQAIRFTRIPSGVSMRSERQGACPGESRFEICHGGQISLQIANTLDPFNYSVNYVVYDLDGAQSGSGVIRLLNTELAKDSVRIRGGGSFGWLSVFAFMGLVCIRYRIKK